MTYFMGMAVLPIRATPVDLAELATLFGSKFSLEDLSGTPFGIAVSRRVDRVAFAPLSPRGDSEDLLGRGNRRRSLVTDFRDVLPRLFSAYGAFAVLVHCARGSWLSEPVEVVGTVSCGLDDFLKIYPSAKEDTRYVVT